MLDVHTITDDRQMRAVTGLDLTTFCALTEPFALGCQREVDACFVDQQPRKCKVGDGCKGLLVSLEKNFVYPLLPQNVSHL